MRKEDYFWIAFLVVLVLVMGAWVLWPTEQEWFEFYGRL